MVQIRALLALSLMDVRVEHNHQQQMNSAQGRAAGKPSLLVVLVRALFLVNGLVWLLLGVLFIIRMDGGNSMGSTMRWVVFVLMLANGLAMFWIGWRIAQPDKRFYYLGIVVLAVNILLSITDEFGWLDLATMLVDVLLLGLLIATRSWYLNKNEPRVADP